jgi:hypothetical protein
VLAVVRQPHLETDRIRGEAPLLIRIKQSFRTHIGCDFVFLDILVTSFPNSQFMSHLFSLLTPKNVVLGLLALLGSIVLFFVLGSLGSDRYRGEAVSLASRQMVGLSPAIPPEMAMRADSPQVTFGEEYTAPLSGDMFSPVSRPESAPPQGEHMLVRSASLSLLVSDIDVTMFDIQLLRDEYKGVMGESAIESGGAVRTGSVTLWVPSADLDSVVEQIGVGAVRVRSSRTQAYDVSRSRVDMIARLKNLEASEVQYQSIMKRAGTITEVLMVERELTQTREHIERLKGELSYLEGQIALSRIDVTLEEEVSKVAGGAWRPGVVFMQAIQELKREAAQWIDTMIVLLVLLPLILIKLGVWLVVFYGIYRALRYAYLRGQRELLPPKVGGV